MKTKKEEGQTDYCTAESQNRETSKFLWLWVNFFKNLKTRPITTYLIISIIKNAVENKLSSTSQLREIYRRAGLINKTARIWPKGHSLKICTADILRPVAPVSVKIFVYLTRTRFVIFTIDRSCPAANIFIFEYHHQNL